MRMIENGNKVVVTIAAKNRGISLILTLLFGSFGLLYTTISGFFIMLAIEVFVAIFTLGFGLIITHIICAVWGVMAVDKYNKELLSKANTSL
jgi:positive regulator of sigma E activity